MYINKWVTFTASLFAELTAGVTYCFSLYSDALKEEFGYSQAQIQGIASACNFGSYLAILSGVFYDALADQHQLGPRLTLALGLLLNLGGYLALYAATVRMFVASHWQVAAMALIACGGSSWTDTSCLVTSVRNFPNERGTVVGLLKSCVGLSASVFTTLYVAFFQPDAVRFLVFLAVAPAAVGLAALPFINYVPFIQSSELESEQQHFNSGGRFLFAYQIMIALGIYQTTTAVINQSDGMMLSRETRILLATGSLTLIAMLSLIPWGSGGLRAKPAFADVLEDEQADGQAYPGGLDGGLDQPLLEEDAEMAEGSQEAAAKGSEGPDVAATPFSLQPVPELSPLRCLVSLNFWLLFVSCCIGIGSGLMYLSNLAQLVDALGGSSPAVFVSLYSVTNCAGRLLGGYIPERFLHSKGTPRPLFFVLVSLLSACVYCYTAFASLPMLYMASVLAGLAFGGHWSLMSAITSEIFGLHHFASNYTLVQLAPALGGWLLSKLAGSLYDKEAHATGHRHTCTGKHCYRTTLLVAGALGMVAVASSIVLYFRTRHIYQTEFLEVTTYDDEVEDVRPFHPPRSPWRRRHTYTGHHLGEMTHFTPQRSFSDPLLHRRTRSDSMSPARFRGYWPTVGSPEGPNGPANVMGTSPEGAFHEAAPLRRAALSLPPPSTHLQDPRLALMPHAAAPPTTSSRF
ncbi:hypothetical protein WJX72_004521 [[Myrmecia] bisecta]|uniref:Nodulin-like domain-containing protein n=1 Tax=[Myrmecia] bisecta TaxID=41462 RepID=A0AAW1Q5I8_9CHLO